MMIRTQISLSEWEYKKAKETAKKEGISLAELLRRSLRLILPVSREKPWMKYAGDVDTGNSPSNEQIDDLIYGQKS